MKKLKLKLCDVQIKNTSSLLVTKKPFPSEVVYMKKGSTTPPPPLHRQKSIDKLFHLCHFDIVHKHTNTHTHMKKEVEKRYQKSKSF